MNVAMYLRKSRADLEAEARGEGETLRKHKTALLKLAKERKLNIIKIYEEIVSGESILHRPEMIKLLDDIENKKYDAVLVMDMERLGRGDMQEQGLILRTFKESKTKIITPHKTYDLDNEFDEEYTEFETFMARRELKMITRRMQRGRVASVEAGNYIGTTPPYGYLIKELKDGRTLEPHPEQSEVVKLIFDWYTHDDPKTRIGTSKIANKLNSMGYLTQTGKQWANYSVIAILKNAVYAGRIQWKKTKQRKSSDPTKTKETEFRPIDEWIDVEGKHEAIISMKQYMKAQEILKTRYHVPYQNNGITNPLAGVIVCGKCGAKMVRRPYTNQKPHLKCYNNPRCDCKSTNLELVEKRIIKSLEQWLAAYKADWNLIEEKKNETSTLHQINQTAIKKLQRELVEIDKQKDNLHDLLERGIYDVDTFLERSNKLVSRSESIKESITKLEKEIKTDLKRMKAKEEIIPQVERVLDLYYKTDDPKKKNSLIKTVLDKAVYTKEKHQYKDDFTLVLYPKLNQNNLTDLQR